MTSPRDGRDTGSTALGGTGSSTSGYSDTTGTRSGGDVTSRMTGTHTGRHDSHLGTRPAKTSAAAVFGLVFGLSALFCALTAILSPAAVLFGLIGLVLSIAGLKMAKRVGVTGKGVALGGLVTSVLGLLLGAAVIGGIAVGVNSESAVDRISGYVDDVRESLPSGSQVEDTVSDVAD